MRKLLIFVVIMLIPLVILFGFGGNDDKTTETLPEISKEAIALAKEQIKQYDTVKDVAIVVEDNYIALAIVTNVSGSKEEARELGEDFAKIFSNAAAIDGEIYKHYNLSIAVATVAEEVIATGSKATNASSITWEEQ